MEPLNVNYRKTKTKFRKCTTNPEKIDFFLKILDTNSVAITSNNHFTKSDEKAIEMRVTGNLYFKQNLYFEAMKNYTASVALAATKEVAALAFSNRSIVLDKVGLYKQSLTDLELALTYGYPEKLQPKLIGRRQNINKKQSLQENLPLKFYSEELISTNIDIVENNIYGRHIVASQDIDIGTILLIENPIGAVLSQDYFFYCHECLTLCYNLLPCETCTKVLYCSKQCKEKAFKNYHYYECSIINYLDSLNIEFNVSLAIKITLLILNEINKKNWASFKEIRKLKTFESYPNKQKDVFILAQVSAFIFKLFKEKTSLFVDYKSSENAFKEILLHNFLIQNVNGVEINRLEPDIKGYRTVPYGRGIYLSYSLFNHSCYPNAFFYHEGSTIIIRALGTIKKGDQCLISYGYTYCSVEKMKRQLLLQKRYNFVCDCRACRENWSEDETENNDFSEPFAAVLHAQLQYDHDLLRTLVPIFINRLRSLEQNAPTKGLSCLRQLVVECYQIYDSTWKY